MKKFILFLLSIFSFNELWADSFLDLSHVKRTIYISSSQGNDKNPGTINAPIKTISSLGGNSKKNVRLMLKKGDVFFESIVGFDNCEIGAYGIGNNPLLCGFKILKDVNKWEYVGTNIWRLNVRDKSNFYGYGQRLSDISYGNIGIIYDYQKDVIYGNMVKDKKELKKKGDFFVSDCLQKQYGTEDFKWLYFYWPENPSKLGHLCFSMAESAVRGVANCKIHDLSIVGYGIHGVNLSKNSVLENCQIDLIGGTLHYAPYFLRLGNGVQIWVAEKATSENVLVSKCQISRTYDTGTTIQGSNTIGSKVKNICFRDNVIAYCRQGFERYLNPASSNATYEKCEFRRNFLFMSGNNKFGLDYMENNVHLLSYEQKARSIDISHNVMYGGNLQFSTFFEKGIKNNTVYIYSDQYLNNASGKQRKLMATDKKVVSEYKKRTGDDSSIRIIEKDSEADFKIRRQVESKMNLVFPKLNLEFVFNGN